VVTVDVEFKSDTLINFTYYQMVGSDFGIMAYKHREKYGDYLIKEILKGKFISMEPY